MSVCVWICSGMFQAKPWCWPVSSTQQLHCLRQHQDVNTLRMYSLSCLRSLTSFNVWSTQRWLQVQLVYWCHMSAPSIWPICNELDCVCVCVVVWAWDWVRRPYASLCVKCARQDVHMSVCYLYACQSCMCVCVCKLYVHTFIQLLYFSDCISIIQRLIPLISIWTPPVRLFDRFIGLNSCSLRVYYY